MNTAVVGQATRSALRHDVLLPVVSACLDIASVWSIDHDPGEAVGLVQRTLLAFADQATLRRLRESEHLHSPHVNFLVVVDGDAFASAWGVSRITGSLARWAWQQTSPSEAFYSESRWAGDERTVVRVRRKAFLVWRRGLPAV
jgi:hypothetical protein